MTQEEKDRAGPQDDSNLKHWVVVTLRGTETPTIVCPEKPQAKTPLDRGQSSKEIV